MRAGARAEELRAALEELEREIDQLRSGAHPTPPAPYTRDPNAREGRLGAPLWRLVDFRDDIASDARAGIEAALEAAGILDGWVTTSAELLDADTGDVLLAAVHEEPTGSRLADALVPAIDEATGVSDATVHRLLRRIGLGESDAPVWVSDRGRFRNGVLNGAWHKPAAMYIGHTAREAAREARIAELHDRATAARGRLAELQQDIAELTRRHAQLEHELTELPSDAAMREADSALAAVEAELAALARRLDDARAREREAQAQEDTARTVLHGDATDLDLPHDGEELSQVEAALRSLREVLAALWPAHERHARAGQACTRAAEDEDAARCEHAETEQRLADAERRLSAAVERRDTLLATAGVAIAELERRLREVAGQVADNDATQTDTEARLGDAQRADSAAEVRSCELRGQLATATEARLSAVEALRRFSTTGLIAVALPEVEPIDPDGEWNVTGALRLAREIEQALSTDSDEGARWQRLQRQVTDELGSLADALRRHGNNAAASFSEEAVVVEVTFRAHVTSLPALAAALAEEVQERQRLLDAREREILENHLVGEVASTLQELITAAERRVADTNRELAERPTSTGMQLRLRWTAVADGPDGLADARARLRQTTDAWSQADRAAVGELPAEPDQSGARPGRHRQLARASHARARLSRVAPVHRRAAAGWRLALRQRPVVRRGARARGQHPVVRRCLVVLQLGRQRTRAAARAARRGVRGRRRPRACEVSGPARRLRPRCRDDERTRMGLLRGGSRASDRAALADRGGRRGAGEPLGVGRRRARSGAARARVAVGHRRGAGRATAVGRVDHERLTRLLGDPALAWVLDRVRRRIELGRPVDGTIARRSATVAERDAVARLLGRPPRAARGLSISLDELDALLRRSGIHSGGLAAAVIALNGPVTVRADAAAEDARTWAAAFARIEIAGVGRPELAEWIDRVRATGIVKRLAGGSPDNARGLLDAVVSVVEALPAPGGESLSAFAARVTGRAHALDDGSPLGTLALGAARTLAGLEPPGPDESPAEARREAWAAVGVLCDELSSTVLTLALPGDSSATGRVLTAAAAGGEPVWLTLRQLVRSPPRWRTVGLRCVLVVENPSFVALAADTPGSRETPIVCTNGQPSAAAMVLLRSLAGASVRLRHHGDFDWGGLTIGNLLHRRLAVEPWHFDRAAYVRAVAAHPHTASLTGTPTTASWDARLPTRCTRRAAGSRRNWSPANCWGNSPERRAGGPGPRPP